MANFNIDDQRRVHLSSGAYTKDSFFQTFAIMIGIIFVLYIAREIFLPFAIAVLLAFALQPIVSKLKKLGLPKVAAVVVSVLFAFLLVGIFSFVVALQVNDLAKEIPVYQNNIIAKVQSLKDLGAGSGGIERLSGVIERLGAEINTSRNAGAVLPNQKLQDPVLVEIFSPQRPIELLSNLIVPLIGPLATAGLVIVVVIFMLLDREELRDRFIRLAGHKDIHRTTSAIQDAGKRVSQYLFMQLVVNITYGIPIGVGLWLIGVPNAMLWGMLAIVLRLIPYIGPFIAMIFPIFLSLAVAPGWSMVMWTVGLFILVELISNNIIEPWLYGSKTGLSAIAIIVAAIFWTWMWGPVGLVLSTPLTVCLVVLGRHVPQFEFLEVMLGNEPVLEPHERLYQRLLSGDPDEATLNAEEILEDDYLINYYNQVAIPALLIGEHDRVRGALSKEQMIQISETAHKVLDNLQDIADEEIQEDDDQRVDTDIKQDPADLDNNAYQKIELPDGEGKHVLCIGGRGDMDDISAEMLAQVLGVQGAQTSVVTHHQIEPKSWKDLDLSGFDTAVVVFLNADSLGQARFLVRRIKRVYTKLRVGIVFWNGETVYAAKSEDLALQLNADFVAFTMTEAVVEGLGEAQAVELQLSKTLRRPRLSLGHSKKALNELMEEGVST